MGTHIHLLWIHGKDSGGVAQRTDSQLLSSGSLSQTVAGRRAAEEPHTPRTQPAAGAAAPHGPFPAGRETPETLR